MFSRSWQRRKAVIDDIHAHAQDLQAAIVTGRASSDIPWRIAGYPRLSVSAHNKGREGVRVLGVFLLPRVHVLT